MTTHSRIYYPHADGLFSSFCIPFLLFSLFFSLGETFLQGAIRGVNEELGLKGIRGEEGKGGGKEEGVLSLLKGQTRFCLDDEERGIHDHEFKELYLLHISSPELVFLFLFFSFLFSPSFSFLRTEYSYLSFLLQFRNIQERSTHHHLSFPPPFSLG